MASHYGLLDPGPEAPFGWYWLCENKHCPSIGIERLWPDPPESNE